ncbi:MAG: ATP-binding cassette domain-containing protein [Verrucomicrobia bacterium]|nr:ATP-binding cassette domain-containing protein [Verrucomicrobiota bacterium]
MTIHIEDLTVRFGDKTVLDRFSLRMRAGEKATLTGRSGCGKTTVLRCLLGFVLPDAGTIRIESEELTARSVWRVRTKLAYVAQEPDLGEGTVRDVLERPFDYHANAHLRDNLARTGELFRRFLLPRGLLDEDITDLSGGEKQRVAIVSAMLLDRRILLLDEASSALDKTSEQAIADTLRERADLTVLSVSHKPDGFGFGGQLIELPGGYEEREP